MKKNVLGLEVTFFARLYEQLLIWLKVVADSSQRLSVSEALGCEEFVQKVSDTPNLERATVIQASHVFYDSQPDLARLTLFGIDTPEGKNFYKEFECGNAHKSEVILDLAGILERRRQARQVKADGTTTLAALIFHHDGRPIVDIRKAWKTACKRAGAPQRLFHDLRRSAVKNLDEAGVSRDVAMSISGHRTQAMYTRYNIADVKRKRKALELTQEFREAQAAQAAQESNVIAISK